MQTSNSRSNSMSSREPSEDPENIANRSPTTTLTTTPEKLFDNSTTDTVSPRDEKKKRRFSMNSFHRARSRPNSIVLPGSNPLFSATPRATPSRELSRVLGEERGRPHSYHAPVSWEIPDSQQVPGHTLSTPPREVQQPQPSRLGVLPSPAKSLFSKHDRDIEEAVPPVPQIPDKLRSSSGLSHGVLQSIIRYATPPIPGAMDTSGVDVSTTKPSGQHSSQQYELEWPLRDREESRNTLAGVTTALPAGVAQREDKEQPVVNVAHRQPKGTPRVSSNVSAARHDREVDVKSTQQQPLDTEHLQNISMNSSSIHRTTFSSVPLSVSDD